MYHAFQSKRILGLVGFFAVLGGTLFFTGRLFTRNTPLVEMERSALTLTDGRLYRVGETTPFYGLLVEHYPNSICKSRSVISNGVLHGRSEGFYSNGIMQVREYFKDGVSHGLREKWHETGSKLSEGMIVNGKLHGLFRRWHSNGQLAEELTMNNGKTEGSARSYYESGSLKAEANVQNGNVIAQRSWTDGEKKPSR